MKLDMCVTVLEPVSTAYFINPSHQSACLFVYPVSLLGNGSVNMLLQQQIHTQQYKNCWARRLQFDQCHIKGKYAISSSQNLLLQDKVSRLKMDGRL
jgi:hypothetical protein